MQPYCGEFCVVNLQLLSTKLTKAKRNEMKQPKYCKKQNIHRDLETEREREKDSERKRDRERAMCRKAVCNVVAMKRNGMEWNGATDNINNIATNKSEHKFE